MTLDELYQQIGKSLFPKIKGDFDVTRDTIEEDTIAAITANALNLMTYDQAVRDSKLRKDVMGDTLGGIDRKLANVLGNDPSSRVELNILSEIMNGEGKTSEKILQVWQKQNAAFEKELAEIKANSKTTGATNTALQERFDSQSALLQESQALAEALKQELETEKLGRFNDRIETQALYHYANKTWINEGETFAKLYTKEALSSANAKYDWKFAEGESSPTPFQKGTNLQALDPVSQQPLNFQDALDLEAKPYLAKKQVTNQEDLNNLPQGRRVQATLQDDSIPKHIREAAASNLTA